MKRFTLAGTIIFVWFQLGCSTYQSKLREVRNHVREGRISEAIAFLEPLAKQSNDDQLVYLLDYATALHIAGRYAESNQALLKADKVADIQDYHSISNIAGSLAFNEGMMQYKGEAYEKILINTYLALNFLMLNNLDEALVEARRINEKLTKFRIDAKLDFEQKNVFAKYLSAVIWEANRNWDDAYIAYNEAYKIDPRFPYLPEDLLRVSKKARRDEDYKKWRAEFPNVKEKTIWNNPNVSELVVIYQQGWAPEKRPDPNSPRMPRLFPVWSQSNSMKLYANGEDKGVSSRLYDISMVSLKTMNEFYGEIFLKRLGGIATKAVVADQLRQKNKLAGDLYWIFSNVTDVADTRQWSTLPESLQIIRIPMEAGKYKINLQGLYLNYAPSGEEKELVEVDLKPGRKTFLTWRSLH